MYFHVLGRSCINLLHLFFECDFKFTKIKSSYLGSTFLEKSIMYLHVPWSLSVTQSVQSKQVDQLLAIDTSNMGFRTWHILDKFHMHLLGVDYERVKPDRAYSTLSQDQQTPCRSHINLSIIHSGKSACYFTVCMAWSCFSILPYLIR